MRSVALSFTVFARACDSLCKEVGTLSSLLQDGVYANILGERPARNWDSFQELAGCVTFDFRKMASHDSSFRRLVITAVRRSHI